MRFQLIGANRADVPLAQVCRLLGVSPSGYYARKASQSQRDGMILIAHIRNAYILSSETYGSPRMTADL